MIRRFPILIVIAALILPLAWAGAPAPALADSGPSKPLMATVLSDEPQTYIIQLEHPSLARYRGGIRDLAPTSSEVTGERKLNVNSPAAQAYLGFLAEQRAAFLQRAAERLGRELEVGYIYDVILNGLTARLSPAEAALVATLPGVKHVEAREIRELLTDRGPGWIGAPAAWGPAAGAGVSCETQGGACGEGVVVGIVDTGINMDHPSFADIGGDGYNHTNPLGAGNYKGWCNPAHPNYDPALVCNDKLIGVYSYTDSGMNPEDSEGHGSHTASTVAGNRLNGVVLDAPTIDLTFDISGVAPHANIIAYDACEDGCPTDDLIAALQQAVTDGVDALNYSISGSGQSPWVASDEQAFLDLRVAGAFVSASAGNAGPGAATVAHGSPWVTTTAASTHDRALVNAVINMTTAQGTVLADIEGRSVTTSLNSSPIVYAGDYGNALCQAGIWGANVFTNQIVVCDRGINARVEKAENVQAAGGDGMILVNAASNGDEEIGDAYAIPGVHLTYDEGLALKAWLANGDTGHVGAIAGTTQDIAENTGDVMAAFSSRGPNNQVPDLIKPDMTAPGVDILAAVSSETGKTNPAYDIYSGTSMSSPHMTGAGALMMQAKHPAWTVAEIQSALMTTAIHGNGVREEDGITPTDPFDRGAGRVNLADALNAGLLLDITEAQYNAADPAAGGDPKTLNYPSMADDACYKSCGWTRTVRNPTGQSMTWNGAFIGEDGLQGTLTVPGFTLAGGGAQTFGVNITDVSGLTPGQWYFGYVIYTEAAGKAPQAHFPVAVKVAGSTDTTMIEKTATPAGAGTGAQITYAVTVKNKVKSSRTFTVSDAVPAGTTYVSGSNTGGWTYNSSTKTLSGSVNLGPATFIWREENRSGYQSMAAEGIPPADLTGLNLETGCFTLGGMDFYYLDQHYTEVIVSMNGVMRAGVPSTPIVLCPNDTPQNIPSPDNPRHFSDNLLAPFWADLDLTGGNIYLVSLIHNGTPHTVIEWENALLIATNKRITFQLWVEDGTDNIWFAYPSGFNTTIGSTSPTATIGAENEAGSEAAKYYYNGTGTVPTGAVDVWVGLQPTTATLGFKVDATTAPVDSNIINEATVTVSTTTHKAWANTRICGAATAKQPGIAIQASNYTLTEWAGSPHDTYQLWRSTTPYFIPGVEGTKVYEGKAFSYVDAENGPTVGDPATNYFYVLRTTNCAGTSSADAYPVGEFGYALTR